MNARLDMLISPSDAAPKTPEAAFACCPRYSAATDRGPEIVGIIADFSERVVPWAVATLRMSLQKAGYSRQ